MSPDVNAETSPRRRRSVAAAIVSTAIIGGAVVTVMVVEGHRRGPADAAAGKSQATTTGMQGMQGMQGMASSTEGPGTVILSAREQSELGVTFGAAAVRPIAVDTRAAGVVTFDEARIAQVSPKFGGFVERLHVNVTGQYVARGEPLFDIYSPDVLAAEQELLVAAQLQANLGKSAVPGVPTTTTDFVAAGRRRLELWDIAPSQIDEVLRTGQPRRSFTLYSPVSGVVVVKNVVEGQAVTAGEMVYTIADLADVWIDADVREADASAARVGAAADIEVTGVPGRKFSGRVAYVYPTLDSASRAIRARVVVANAGRLLKPGMYATVHLTAQRRVALTVPASAVLRTGVRDVVFVDAGNGRLVPTEITVGQSAGDFTEVLSGLTQGQRVATSAQFLLDSESNLGEVMRSMLSQMPGGTRQP